jgi:hypothetical protein
MRPLYRCGYCYHDGELIPVGSPWTPIGPRWRRRRCDRVTQPSWTTCIGHYGDGQRVKTVSNSMQNDARIMQIMKRRFRKGQA